MSHNYDMAVAWWYMIMHERTEAGMFAFCVIHNGMSVYGSSMLAVALDDFSVCIVDTDTRRVVRSFKGHTNSITDMVSCLLLRLCTYVKDLVTCSISLIIIIETIW